MNQIVKYDSNLIEQNISIIGNEPIYSKQINNVEKIEFYFNKRFGSSYNRKESKFILISLEEFMKLNINLISLSLPFKMIENGKTTNVIGVDTIENINDYIIIYDIDSGWIAITKTKNIIIN